MKFVLVPHCLAQGQKVVRLPAVKETVEKGEVTSCLSLVFDSPTLGFDSDQLQPTAFWLPKPKNSSPCCRIALLFTRMTGIDSPSWRRFTGAAFFFAPTGQFRVGGPRNCRRYSRQFCSNFARLSHV